jgi:putative transposase
MAAALLGTCWSNSLEKSTKGHYWEHLIRDDADFQRHIDYVHANPLKHGRVKRVADWPYSTFHKYVAKGIYPSDWCDDANSVVGGDE